MGIFQSLNSNNQPTQPQNTQQPSRVKSVVRYTMMPEILPRIRALGIHFGHFAYLLALVFSSARLLPNNHPALNAANIGRFGVRQVIAMAANNITWSRQNIDQIAIFGAIVIGLIMIVIQAGLIAFAALVGFNPAEAQDVGSFFDPGGSYRATDDPMMIFFAQVFGDLDGFWGASFVSDDKVFGTNTVIHDGLYAMLSLYSRAMMVIAVIIVIYYIMTVVGEAAKTGTPFGQRFNSLWAPIRLVIALGLLVPLGSGLNSAQYLTLWIAKMGSGFGTKVWGRMADNFEAEESKNYIIDDYKNDWVRDAALQVLMMDTCRYSEAKYNKTPISGERSLSPKIDLEDDEKYIYKVVYEVGEEWRDGESHRKCGEISLELTVDKPESLSETDTSVPVGTVFELSKKIINALVFGGGGAENKISEIAQKIANSEISTGGIVELDTPLEKLVSDVMEHADTVKGEILSGNVTGELREELNEVMTDLVSKSKNSWVYAGVWYLEIGRIIQNSKYTQKNSIPNFTKGNITYRNRGNVGGSSGETDSDGSITYARLSKQTKGLIEDLEKYFTENRRQFIRIEDDGSPKKCEGLGDDSDYISWIGCLIVGTVVPYELVLLARPENKTLNPMSSLVNAGTDIFNRSVTMFVLGIAAKAMGDGLTWLPIPQLKKMGKILSALAGVVVFIGAIGFGIGIVLAYLLPILPFMYFFFAIVSWMMEIAEAVIAMPLWALAHLRIDGDGMPGAAAVNGYYLLLAILLRPVLIVLGLVVSSIIFGAAIYLLQELFYQVLIVSEGGSVSSFDVLVYAAIFAFMTYTAGITSFKLVDKIPNQIIRWLGSSAQTFSDGNDVDLQGNQGLLLAAGTVAGNNFAGTVGGLTRAQNKGAGDKDFRPFGKGEKGANASDVGRHDTQTGAHMGEMSNAPKGSEEDFGAMGAAAEKMMQGKPKGPSSDIRGGKWNSPGDAARHYDKGDKDK